MLLNIAVMVVVFILSVIPVCVMFGTLFPLGIEKRATTLLLDASRNGSETQQFG